MQMISQNEDFMNELLDKCNSDSKIEIGFLESTETGFIHYNYGTDAKDVIRGGKLSTYQVDTWNRWDCCKDITNQILKRTILHMYLEIGIHSQLTTNS